jgi:hypothetical protein
MNIRRLTVALVAVAAASITVAGPAVAALPAAPSGTLTIYTHQTQRDVLDLGATGTTVGDVVTGSGTVSLKKNGKSVGSYSYRSETVRVNMPGGNESRLSTNVYTLPGGTIMATGLVSVSQGTRPTKPQPQIIIGGTGKYAGAQGTMTLTPKNANDYVRTFIFVS